MNTPSWKSGRILLALAFFLSPCSGHTQSEGDPPLKGVVMPVHQSKLGFEQAGVVTLLPLEGERFEKGAVLARMNEEGYREKLAKSKALLAKARLTLEQALHERAKVGRLLDQKVVSEMGIKEAEFAVTQGQAGVEQAASDLRVAEKGLRDCELKAPFAGVVVSVKAGLGEYVQTGAELLQLANLSQLELGIDLQPEEAIHLKEGVTGTMMANDGAVGTVRLRVILPLVDPASGLQRTIWTVSPRDPAIISGRYVTVTIEP